jgi:hypothetical protein
MAAATRHVLLVNDLLRSRINLALVYLGSRLVSRSDVVHTDGPRSVRAAFSASEVLALADVAELHGATIKRCWPCRFLLKWMRPE